MNAEIRDTFTEQLVEIELVLRQEPTKAVTRNFIETVFCTLRENVKTLVRKVSASSCECEPKTVCGAFVLNAIAADGEKYPRNTRR